MSLAKTSRSCTSRCSPRSSPRSSSCWRSPASGSSSWRGTSCPSRAMSAMPPTSSSRAWPTSWSIARTARSRSPAQPQRHHRRDRDPVRVPRTATVVAASDLETLRISKEGFFQLVNQFPQIGIEVMPELASRLHHTTQALTQAKGKLRELENAPATVRPEHGFRSSAAPQVEVAGRAAGGRAGALLGVLRPRRRRQCRAVRPRSWRAFGYAGRIVSFEPLAVGARRPGCAALE